MEDIEFPKKTYMQVKHSPISWLKIGLQLKLKRKPNPKKCVFHS